jgi:hypothetical protein
MAPSAVRVRTDQRPAGDPVSGVATEVFEDDAARERQESLAEVARVLGMLPDAVAAPPEATVFRVSASEPAIA